MVVTRPKSNPSRNSRGRMQYPLPYVSGPSNTHFPPSRTPFQLLRAAEFSMLSKMLFNCSSSKRPSEGIKALI